MRLTASDRSFDLLFTVHALRKDGSPILARFPIDPMAAQPPVKFRSAMARNRERALDVLGLTADATDEAIKKIVMPCVCLGILIAREMKRIAAYARRSRSKSMARSSSSPARGKPREERGHRYTWLRARGRHSEIV